MAKETEEQIEARMEAARNKLSQDVQDKFNKEGDVDERDRRLETAASAPKTNQGAAKPKSGIVTKKQLKESGLSLRDYMNKQQGKTRRDGKAPEQKTPEQKTPESQKPATPINRARPTPEGSKSQQYGSPSYMRNEKRIAMEKARKEIQPQRREEQKISQRRTDIADSIAAVATGFSAVPGGIGGTSNLVKRLRRDKDEYMRPAEAGMKKGGRVTASSASKRADGIAQRGKTRGRVY